MVSDEPEYPGAAADLQVFAQSVRPDDPVTPLVTVAHSTGGLIVLGYLHHHPDSVEAVVLSAPMFAPHTGELPGWLVRYLSRLGVVAGFGAFYIPGARDWR